MNRKQFVMNLRGQSFEFMMVLSQFKFVMSADDTNNVYSGRNYDFVENTVKNELDKVK